MSVSRRHFVQSTALAAGASLLFHKPLLADENKTYSLALIGSGWWGMNILASALEQGQCKLSAICDVDDAQMDKAAATIKQKTGNDPKRYKDYRELLKAEKPEIVIVGTPDHWHPLITIAAVQAGAHVYVEKPIGHTIYEGRAMVKAARDTGKTVQVGTHRRVSPHNLSGLEFMRSGKVGKIGMARCFVHYGGGPEKPRKNMETPKGLDWDMWCGPAPLCTYNPGIHPRGFRNYLDYGNGQLGDWGIHWLDQVRWAMELKAPRKVFSAGGRTIAGPAINTAEERTSDGPDHQVTVFDFENDFTVHWEHRRFAGNGAEKADARQPVGVYFYGEKGTFHMGWLDGWTFYPTNSKEAPIHQDAKLNEPDQQNIKELWADFMQSIAKKSRPLCDIEEGHRSTTMALLGMLSLKAGRSVQWDGEKEEIVGDPEASRLLSRKYRGEWEYPKWL